MVSQFNSVYGEFKIVKNSMRKLDENIRKSFEGIIIGEAYKKSQIWVNIRYNFL